MLKKKIIFEKIFSFIISENRKVQGIELVISVEDFISNKSMWHGMEHFTFFSLGIIPHHFGCNIKVLLNIEHLHPQEHSMLHVKCGK